MNRVLFAAIAGLAASSGAMAQLSINASNVSFTDISGTGTSVGAISDDSEHTISAATLAGAGFMGNWVLAGGVDIRIGNNGGVIWNPTGTMEVGYSNANLLTMAAANGSSSGNGNGVRQFVTPFWTDMYPAPTGSSVTWQVIGGDLFIQWTGETLFSLRSITPPQIATFQMIVRSSGPSLIDFVYADTFFATGASDNDGASASIGMRNWGVGGFNDVQFSFNTASVAGSVEAGNPNLPHSVSIVPTPGAAALLGIGGLATLRRRRK